MTIFILGSSLIGFAVCILILSMMEDKENFIGEFLFGLCFTCIAVSVLCVVGIAGQGITDVINAIFGR